MAALPIAVLVCVAAGLATPAHAASIGSLRFTETSIPAGVAIDHADSSVDFETVASGAAAGDFDGDGWPDLYVIGGDASRQFLFRNLGDGSFLEIALEAGVALIGEKVWGPAFADVDGDFDLDLFVGGNEALGPGLFLNQGEGAFSESARAVGMFPQGIFVSASFGDYDGDSDLDLLTTHWAWFRALGEIGNLWQNDGAGRFSVVPEAESGLVIKTESTDIGPIEWTFTGNFVDLDGDGHEDVVLASDYETSQVFRNLGNGRFEDVTTNVISDENGMGAAVGDFDNDGDLDWFVTSIFDDSGIPNDEWGSSGNRLYANEGGVFVDVTQSAGVREGFWGWGACAADFDLDGDLDIFHVNGAESPSQPDRWLNTPARLYLNRGDGKFDEAAAAAGVDDHGNGRGVVCFDYDRDGDVDIFVSNVKGPTRLFRNDLGEGRTWLQVKLVGRSPNTEGIGAVVTVTSGETAQVRHIHSGNNYASQNPAVAHFGLADAERVDDVRVRWPSGVESLATDVRAGREIVVYEIAGDANEDQRSTGADLVFTTRARASGEPTSLRGPRWDLTFDEHVDERDFAVILGCIFAGTP